MPQVIPNDAEFWRGYYGGRKPERIVVSSTEQLQDAIRNAPEGSTIDLATGDYSNAWLRFASERTTHRPKQPWRLNDRSIRVLDGTRGELEAKHADELAKFRAALNQTNILLDSERAMAEVLRKTISAERTAAVRFARRNALYGVIAGAIVGGFAGAMLIDILTKVGP